VRNVHPRSGDLTNAGVWTPVNATPTIAGGASPVGSWNLITDTVAGGANVGHYIASTLNGIGGQVLSVGTPVVLSWHVKAGTKSWALLQFGASVNAYVNLATGALGTTSGGTWSIAATSDGYRVSVLTSIFAIGGGSAYVTHGPTTGNGVPTYVGDGIGTIYVDGIQLEPAYPGQTTPSPYVPTGAAPLSVVGTREWRENLLPQCNRPDLTPWIAASATPATIVTGLADPLGGTRAFSVQDFSAGEFQGAQQLLLSVGADKKTLTANVYVKKTVGALNTVGAALNFYGGSGVNTGARLNPNTGVPNVGTVVDAGAWWLWSFSVTNNGTNPNATLTLYPAPGTIAGGDSVAGVGTAVFALPRLFWGAGPFADHIDTTSAPANSSGAPRSQAL
jgi:hypothetical protein